MDLARARQDQAAARHPKLSQMLVTMFNDLDHKNVASLQAAIETMPEVKKLKHQPRVYNHEVGTEIAKQFDIMKMILTFFFVDPWGYKNLSLKLINSVLQNWGCDWQAFDQPDRIDNRFLIDYENLSAATTISRGGLAQ
jgi:three-Cys-motif partner protein